MTQIQYIRQLERQVEFGKNAEKEWEEKCQKLEKEKLKLEEDNLVLEQKLANSEKDYQKLTLAKALGLTEQQKKDNHLMLARLIDGIDKCLKLLKESNL